MNLSIAQLDQTMRKLPEYAKLQRIQTFREVLPVLAVDAFLSSNRTKKVGYIAVDVLIQFCELEYIINVRNKLMEKTGILIDGDGNSLIPAFEVIGKTPLTKDGLNLMLYAVNPLADGVGTTISPNTMLLYSHYGPDLDKLKTAILKPETMEDRALATVYEHEKNHLAFNVLFGEARPIQLVIDKLSGQAFPELVFEMSEFHATLAQAVRTPQELCRFQFPALMEFGNDSHKVAALRLFGLLGIQTEAMFHLDSEKVQDEILFSIERNKVMLSYLEQNYSIAAYHDELTKLLRNIRWTITGVNSDEPISASQLLVHTEVVEYVLKIVGKSADEFADDIRKAYADVSKLFDALLRELEKAKDVAKFLP